MTERRQVTTEAILEAEEGRTGLTRAQLLVLVAKSATVRHLATNHEYKDLFVLKGGTLLSNVYRSPRQSIADADYTHLDPKNLTTPGLEKALAISGKYGFELRPEEGHISIENQIFEARVPFSMEEIEMSKRWRDRQLKVTVSVRPGEWLDKPDNAPVLIYSDPLLADDSIFPVNGLTRNELAAEKILGWCSKPLPKHFVDLAYLAREHHEHIAHETVASLIVRKFEKEKGAYRYQNAGIRRTRDLVGTFASNARLRDLRRDWGRFTDTELLVLPREQENDATLTDVANVERLAIEFWERTLELLR